MRALRLASLLVCTATLGCGSGYRRHTLAARDGSITVVDVYQGRPNGAFVRFHPNKRLAARGRYVDGQRDGSFDYFDAEGNLVRREVWSVGLLLEKTERVRVIGGGYTWRHVTYKHGRVDAVRVSQDAGEKSTWREVEARPEVLEYERRYIARQDTLEIPVLADAPRYPGLGRATTHSTAGAEIGAHLFPGQSSEQGMGRRVDVFGQYFFGDAGAYLQATTGDVEAKGIWPSQRARTVFELGGLWRRRELGPGSLVIKGGVFAPLAGDDREGFATSTVLQYQHLSDAVYALPNTIGVRGGGSYGGAHGRWFYRGDVGFDLAFDTSGGELGLRESPVLLARLGLGGGVGWDGGAFSLSLMNVGRLTGSGGDRWTQAGALGFILRTGVVQPYASVVMPMEADLRGDVFVFALGLELAEGVLP